MKKSLIVSACILLTACAQSPAPKTVYGTSKGAGSTGVHTVVKGETVYEVSKAYRLPVRDIITTNSLSAPYRLNVGYRLKLPPPREYKVKSRDTMRSIAMMHDTTTTEIARLNNLYAPYSIRTGQVLRLPTPSVRAAVAKAAAPHVERAVASPAAKIEREVLPPKNNARAPTSAPTQSASTSNTSSPVVKPPSKPSVQKASASRSARASLPKEVPARSGNGKFMKPVNGKIVSNFGPKADGLHNDGINIKAPKGTPVRGAENGVVVYAGSELKGYGNLILIRHADQWMTAYAHLDKMLVKKGDTIRRGQSIGTVGSTGQVDSPQLHFEVRRGTDAKNPQTYL